VNHTYSYVCSFLISNQVNVLVLGNYGWNLSRINRAVSFFIPPFGNLTHTTPSFLPETLRALVGNGSVSVAGLRKPMIPIVGRKSRVQVADAEKSRTPSKPFMNPFIIFTYPDIVVLLTFTGIVYAVNYTITASISSSFAVVYPYLSETAIGLCYLSSGGGMIIGSTTTGKLLDWEYRRIEKRDGTTEDFPFEYARLRLMPLFLVTYFACVFAWGWVLQSGVSIAVPLVLQFIRKQPENPKTWVS
jgi:hypothetical protein